MSGSSKRHNIERGQIYWLKEAENQQGAEIKKPRPWVVVGANPLNKGRKTVLAVPLTTSARPSPPIIVEVDALGKKGVGVVIDQIRASDKSRFGDYADGELTAEEMERIDDALRVVLSL